MNQVRPFRIILCVTLVAWIACATASVHASASTAAVQVRTANGAVLGVQLDGLQVFRSIPYAEPPVGALRFKRAVPAKPWSHPRDASTPGPACYQVLDLDDSAEDGDRIQSEDCLTLNVWTPDSAAGRRPVMVWVHGGGFEEGSAADSWYDGAALARSGDVVVVTLQYRLGALGFLDLSGLEGGAAFAGSGNNGLTDQVQALRWVQQNIARFGGDPANVTIFGESAGGASVRALMAIPEARDLFHKVIVESGSGHFLSQARAAEIGRAFAKVAGVKNVAELQRLTPAAIMAAQSDFFDAGYGSMPFGIVNDGVVFRHSTLDTIAADPRLAKPMLIGTNAEEMRYWVAMDANGIERQPEGRLRERLKTLFGPGMDEALNVYQRDTDGMEEAITTLIGDAVFRIPSIRLAEVNAQHQPTYMYLFTYRSLTRGKTGLEYGAMHGLEVAFVFQLDTTQGYTYVGPKGTWRHLSNQMMQAWTRFARTGDPNGPLLPRWPQYDKTMRATMAFGQRSDAVLDPYGAERRAWDGVPATRLEAAEVLGLADLPPPAN